MGGAGAAGASTGSLGSVSDAGDAVVITTMTTFQDTAILEGEFTNVDGEIHTGACSVLVGTAEDVADAEADERALGVDERLPGEMENRFFGPVPGETQTWSYQVTDIPDDFEPGVQIVCPLPPTGGTNSYHHAYLDGGTAPGSLDVGSLGLGSS